MSDDFSGPGTISFSGGRTSALMLWRMREAGALENPDLHVVFANTGREREETLAFVDDVARHWSVNVQWLEFQEATPHFRATSFAEASRKGEPFEALLRKRKFLPNPVARFCTQELKIRVMRDWMKSRGYQHWTNYVGIRRDEPRRAARLLDPAKPRRERFEVALPLWDWGVTQADVSAFWATQPFGLRLEPHEGNCDLCFLKTADKRVAIARARPDLAEWWHEQERLYKASFRKEGTLAQLLALAERREIDAAAQGDLFTCFCGDDTEVNA